MGAGRQEVRIKVGTTAAECAEIDAAVPDGQTRSAFCRDVLLAHVRKETPPGLEEPLRAHLRALREGAFLPDPLESDARARLSEGADCLRTMREAADHLEAVLGGERSAEDPT